MTPITTSPCFTVYDLEAPAVVVAVSIVMEPACSFTEDLISLIASTTFVFAVVCKAEISPTAPETFATSVLSFTLSNGEKIEAGKITIDTGNINLENYYTKTQTDKKFVQLLELDNLILKKIEEIYEIATQEEIENIFIERG